nr:ABC transporter substrate-binding protein [uncultured Desulfobacter sp.]
MKKISCLLIIAILLNFNLFRSDSRNQEGITIFAGPEAKAGENAAKPEKKSPCVWTRANKKNIVRFSLARTGGPVLDPHSMKGDFAIHFNPNVFEGLLKIKPDTGELIPALAQSYEWLSPEIVEFRLRRGVTFHNGDPVDAEAVKYSFERMAAVTGSSSWIKWVVPEFQRVEIIDPHTVRIHLSRHNSIFLMSMRFFSILPKLYLEEHGAEYFMAHPVGTGPFKICKIEYDHDGVVQAVYMEKNKNYWDTGKPYLNGLVYYFGMTQQQSLKKLLMGEVDAMGALPIRNILDVRKKGLVVHQKGQGLITWLYFNLSKYKKNSPVWNPLVRKAILHSIDFDRIKAVVYNNRASQNNQWAFPGIPGFSNQAKNYSFNVALSRTLLKQAGYDKGFSLKAYCDDVTYEESRILKSSLAVIGINVEFDVLDELSSNCILMSKRNPGSPCHPMLKKYDFMVGDFGWGFPHNFVTHLHTFSPEAAFSLVSDEYPGSLETIDMFLDAKSTFGEENAAKKWEKISEYELDRLAICGLMLKKTYYSTVKNLKFDIYGTYDFTEARYVSE